MTAFHEWLGLSDTSYFLRRRTMITGFSVSRLLERRRLWHHPCLLWLTALISLVGDLGSSMTASVLSQNQDSAHQDSGPKTSILSKWQDFVPKPGFGLKTRSPSQKQDSMSVGQTGLYDCIITGLLKERCVYTRTSTVYTSVHHSTILLLCRLQVRM